MSYDIGIYRIETKIKEQESKQKDFFEDEKNLIPFSKEQKESLIQRLFKYNFNKTNENNFGIEFLNTEYETLALLTKTTLYFQASWNEESIFEVGMTASEFTDTGEYAKYDPQNGEWEEI